MEEQIELGRAAADFGFVIVRMLVTGIGGGIALAWPCAFIQSFWM